MTAMTNEDQKSVILSCLGTNRNENQKTVQPEIHQNQSFQNWGERNTICNLKIYPLLLCECRTDILNSHFFFTDG